MKTKGMCEYNIQLYMNINKKWEIVNLLLQIIIYITYKYIPAFLSLNKHIICLLIFHFLFL